MALELVAGRQVSVIVANSPGAQAIKTAITRIPIVFTTAVDPVQYGLVASLARPGGNVTGVTQLAMEIAPKRLELAHELAPAATIIPVLVNPANTNANEPQLRDLQVVASSSCKFTSSMPVPSAISMLSLLPWGKCDRARS